MIPQNKAEFDKLNITKWHKSGYTGKGATIVVLDVSGDPFPKDRVIEPLRHLDGAKYSWGHKTQTCAVAREILPDVNIYAFKWNSGFKQEIIQWVREHQDEIDVINCSFATTNSDYKNLLAFEEFDIPFVVAVGNTGNSYVGKIAELPFVFGIGAWVGRYDRLDPDSNYGELMDFVTYTNIYYNNSDCTNTVLFTATSCASAVASSMIALYSGYRREQGLSKMTRQEAFEFMLLNVDDKLTPGRDDESGFGLFRLPNEIIPLEEKEDTPIIPPEKESDTMEFKDTNNHWAKEYIAFLVDKGEMNGYPDGTFKPDNPLTRAEYASMRAKQLGFVKKK